MSKCKYCEEVFFEYKNGSKIYPDIPIEGEEVSVYYVKQASGKCFLYIDVGVIDFDVLNVKYCTMCGRKL